MKVTRSQSFLVAAACLIIAASAAQSATDRPPGVDERSWVPISDTAGIVLTDMATTPSSGAFEVRGRDGKPMLPGALQRTGILMVKSGSTWVRVDLQLPPPRVQPLL